MHPIDLDFKKVSANIKIRSTGSKKEIWDILRKKWLVLQPEEWIRQNIIHVLIDIYGYSKNSIALEKAFQINGRIKRFDVLVYDSRLQPYLLIECKSFDIPMQQNVFDQLSVYNIHVKAPFLVASNGAETYCFKQNHDSRHLTFLEDIPEPDKGPPIKHQETT